MSLSDTDFNKLYRLQNKFLAWWATLDFPFYLTGGTALGRFYLNHRYSEDLDFFMNNDPRYNQYIDEFIQKVQGHFSTDLNQALFTDDFTRLYVSDEEVSIKIELINDVPYYAGMPFIYKYGLIDTPLNILANKLAAITGRDEPKDIFDIIHLSLNYSYNWREIFSHAKQKAVINELDVEQRLATFPVEWLQRVNWIISPSTPEVVRNQIRQIADDFLLGSDNSLGKAMMPVGEAVPRISGQ